MMVYLLDTNIIIDVLNNKRDRYQQLRQLQLRGHLLACCSINVTEIYAGMRAREEAHTEEFLRSLEYFSVTFLVARLAGLLKRDYSRKGKTLTFTDATIAAVAIHHEIPLITDNVKDFPMKEVELHSMQSF
ncbi:MAG: type II toxin-antitoxin system VapC family toxin [Bryobacteraceae bacterium]